MIYRQTLKESKDLLKTVKMSISATPHGEYRVNHLGGTEDTAYYASNLTDAVNTALHMANQRGQLQ